MSIFSFLNPFKARQQVEATPDDETSSNTTTTQQELEDLEYRSLVSQMQSRSIPITPEEWGNSSLD